MTERIEILTLLKDLEELNLQLSGLIYGSIEIRERDNNKYAYVHYREEGIQRTKYVGEYSQELHNLILSNSIKAKELKKAIRGVQKKLKILGYVEKSLDKKIALNIDFARKNMVDTIYKQAVLEGVATTFSDTETIIEGGKVTNMTSDDVMKVVNLKHAWEFILNKDVILSPTNYSLLCEINKFIEEGFFYNAGELRSVPVNIGGTKWKPNLPIECDIKESIQKIVSSNLNTVDKAIELLLFTTKSQMFIDGNKRTAVVFANHFLIANGLGIIVVPENNVGEYKKLLIDYYEGKDEQKIKEFLKEKCYLKI